MLTNRFPFRVGILELKLNWFYFLISLPFWSESNSFKMCYCSFTRLLLPIRSWTLEFPKKSLLRFELFGFEKIMKQVEWHSRTLFEQSSTKSQELVFKVMKQENIGNSEVLTLRNYIQSVILFVVFQHSPPDMFAETLAWEQHWMLPWRSV